MQKIYGRKRFWNFAKNNDTKKESNTTVILKVKYSSVMRKIELKETRAFDNLNDAIIYDAFEWNDPHMCSFFMDNKTYSRDSKMEYTCDAESINNEYGPYSSAEKLLHANLKKGQKFIFLFDFGDKHRFSITVEDFRKVQKDKKYPVILEKKGNAPEQYPYIEE